MAHDSADSYLRRHQALRQLWLEQKRIYSYLEPNRQLLVHDYFRPSEELTAEALRAHQLAIAEERPDLPDQAEQAFNELLLIGQGKAKPYYVGRGDLQVAAVVRPQIDYDKLALAFIKLGEDVVKQRHAKSAKLPATTPVLRKVKPTKRRRPLSEDKLWQAQMIMARVDRDWDRQHQSDRARNTGLPSSQSQAYTESSMVSNDSNEEDRVGFVLEQLEDQLTAILEGQSALAGVPGAIADLQQDVNEVKSDIKAIKAAVTDQTGQLNDHEVRITDLEQAA